MGDEGKQTVHGESRELIEKIYAFGCGKQTADGRNRQLNIVDEGEQKVDGGADGSLGETDDSLGETDGRWDEKDGGIRK